MEKNKEIKKLLKTNEESIKLLMKKLEKKSDPELFKTLVELQRLRMDLLDYENYQEELLKS